MVHGEFSLLQFEVAQILQNNVRHRHAKSGGKILFCHGALPGRVGEKTNEASSQVLGVPRLVKVNCHPFAVRHLAKIRKIGANDGNSIGTSQVRDPAGTGRRGIGHDGNGRGLKKIGQSIFMKIAGEFNFRVSCVLLLHRFHVAGSVGMVPSANHQPGVRQNFRHVFKRFDHQLQPLVGSPLAEGQNAMFRIAAPVKAGEFGLSREDAVGAKVNVIATVFFAQDLTIAGHKYGNGVGEKKHFCSDGAGQTIGARITDAGVFQINRVHQMMQGHVGVAAAQTCKKRRQESSEGNHRIASEGTEEEIKPNHVGLKFVDCTQNVKSAGKIIERPAALNGIVLQLRFERRDFIGKNGEADKGIAL